MCRCKNRGNSLEIRIMKSVIKTLDKQSENLAKEKNIFKYFYLNSLFIYLSKIFNTLL